jgi:transcriptional regulator with XRE-family HTH domain
MAGQGRKPDLKRRQEVHKLRQQGLTVQKIAVRLGITHQGVSQLLRPIPVLPHVLCAKCGATMAKGKRGLVDSEARPLCLACLAKLPVTTFGERLLALRLSRGLTRQELAHAAGVQVGMIRSHERGAAKKPHRAIFDKLVRLLGPTLVSIDVGAG